MAFGQKILLAFLGSSCAISLTLNCTALAAIRSQCKRKSGRLARRRRNNTMKRLNAAARSIFWLGMVFAIVFLVRAESGDKRTSVIPQKEQATARLRIFDQNGQPAVSGVPSPTGAIFDVAVGQGGDVFVPDTVSPAVLLACPIRNIVPLTI